MTLPTEPTNYRWNGSLIDKLSTQQLNELKKTMSSVDYQSELKGKTVYHGTTESQRESVEGGP